LKDPLVANQFEASLMHLDAFENGTLDQCIERGITPLAWSPLAGGFLGNGKTSVLPTQENYKPAKVRRRLDLMARDFGVSRGAVALAWLLRHPAGIVPIVGSTQPERIRELAAATELQLSREQWYALLTSALKEDLP
jgi:predicted oxidoreductase